MSLTNHYSGLDGQGVQCFTRKLPECFTSENLLGIIWMISLWNGDISDEMPKIDLQLYSWQDFEWEHFVFLATEHHYNSTKILTVCIS